MISNDKMTIEDAILILKDKNSNIDHASSYVGVDWTKVYNFAIDAMEKQVPKKPEGQPNTCPTCGMCVPYNERHCSCGQKMDWTGYEYPTYESYIKGLKKKK